MSHEELKVLLDERYDRYCRLEFIGPDPISVPHRFEDELDREVSGLIAATIAWGQRPTIVRNAERAMHLMGNEPHRFVMEHSESDLIDLRHFVHRTFNGQDLIAFVKGLRHIYTNYPSLQHVFVEGMKPEHSDMKQAIHHFRSKFLGGMMLKRSEKHVSDPMKGSSSKRLNMFLRWMVRPNDRGVDFGQWTSIPTSILSCPLDVHSGRVAHELGLLKRSQNDWTAVEELDRALRTFDPIDPVKYDFALFGMGVIQD